MIRNICIYIMVPLISFFGCKPKDPPKITERYKVNRDWVYKTMKENYLWSAELPEFDASKPNTPTQEYFDTNLRYRYNKGISDYRNDTRGDRFSRIEYTGKGDPDADVPTRSGTGQQFDHGFQTVLHITRDNRVVYLQVLFVQPGSAADGVLRRGDVFTHINGVQITSREQFTEQMSRTSVRIEVLNREGEETYEVTISKRGYYDHPILVDTVYDADNLPGPTAYLLYNHFTDGGKNGVPNYKKELEDVFGKFCQAGVRNLILDLRYNGGGEMENAEFLAGLIAPRESVERGDVFMYLEDNKSFGNKERFTPKRFKPGEGSLNPGIENLFIITSRNTASASEMIIHTLKPFYGSNLHIIGDKTVGKNLGSITYEHSQYSWNISPIVLRIHDVNRESGYEGGKYPDGNIVRREYVSFRGEFGTLPPHGDFEHEWLLNYVVTLPPFNQPLAPGSPEGDMSDYRTRSGEMMQTIETIPQRGLSAGCEIVED